ncbi:hypothetical protein QMK19_16290 [Streptomyces sp. H10-C2]|uniref:hypothetical protein n=1 Tax=unclassified Streptomyces TaxID=2593676 RepID=UPI0024B8F8D9|nr:MULTISPECIES: hypothetical protein [unclassified Streptomyces]MDJ0345831.1 hypothetical protein [Streptomyces sp. PH10-H1]MDJ0371203.1 hypothetical protein [Streptomyces sp. H10-C2]
MGWDITVFAVDWERFEQVPTDVCMDLSLNDSYPADRVSCRSASRSQWAADLLGCHVV